MPMKFKTVLQQVITGMVCDVCRKDTKGRSDHFQIDHVFSYGSKHDGDRVQAAICDDCLADLIKSHVPAATWIF